MVLFQLLYYQDIEITPEFIQVKLSANNFLTDSSIFQVYSRTLFSPDRQSHSSRMIFYYGLLEIIYPGQNKPPISFEVFC
jgi:hypothetical protein